MMRRRVSLALACIFLIGSLFASSPAGAVEKSRSKSLVFNAFWYSTKKVAKGVTLRTTWYVGVYQSDETWSDLYQSVYRCEKKDGRRRCSQKSYRIGFDDLADDTFELSRDLTSGYLSATYELQKYARRDGRRVKVGDPVPVHIESSVEGVGDLRKWRYTDTYSDGCTTWRYQSRGVSRNGIAVGILNGKKDLGETDDVWMSRGNSLWMERTC